MTLSYRHYASVVYKVPAETIDIDSTTLKRFKVDLTSRAEQSRQGIASIYVSQHFEVI